VDEAFAGGPVEEPGGIAKSLDGLLGLRGRADPLERGLQATAGGLVADAASLVLT
jgi:hypothetical protein